MWFLIKILIKTISFISLILICTVISIYGREEYEQNFLLPYLINTVVKIQNVSGYSGTGFTYNYKNKIYLITNEHVCRNVVTNDYHEISYLVYENNKVVTKKAKPLSIDIENDLCISKIESKYYLFKGSYNMGIYGYSFGFGDSNNRYPSFLKGNITTYLKKEKQLWIIKNDNDRQNCIKHKNTYIKSSIYNDICYVEIKSSLIAQFNVHPGASGSPVVDIYGNLIGVVKAVSMDGYTETIITSVENVNKAIDEYEGTNEK